MSDEFSFEDAAEPEPLVEAPFTIRQRAKKLAAARRPANWLAILGGLLAIGGAIGLAAFFAMDTTIATDFGRIHNLGLMSLKANGITASGFAAVAGICLWGIAKISRKE